MAWGKYHNRKVVIDGITFDSQREGDYYCELKMLLYRHPNMIFEEV